MRTRLRPRRAARVHYGRWLVYVLGRALQVTGLLVTLVAATQFFGTPKPTAMLRMMLVGVAFFVPGWLLARRRPGGSA